MKVKKGKLKAALDKVSRGAMDTKTAAAFVGVTVNYMNQLMREAEVRRPKSAEPTLKQVELAATQIKYAQRKAAAQQYLNGRVTLSVAAQLAEISEAGLRRWCKRIEEEKANAGQKISVEISEADQPRRDQE